MPGKSISRNPWLLLSLIPLVCLSIRAVIAADIVLPGNEAHFSAKQDADSTWSHWNLQLVTQLTTGLGYRDASILRHNFTGQPDDDDYRAFVVDGDVYTFAGDVGTALETFAVPVGMYVPETGHPTRSHMSFYMKGTSYETLVWAPISGGLLSVTGNTPSNPRLHGTLDLGLTPTDVAVSLFRHNNMNYYAIYALNGTEGLRIFRVDAATALSNLSLRDISTFDTPGDALASAFRDSLLYVADGVSGLQIIDVWDMYNPYLFADTLTSGPAKAVCVVDSLIAVAEWDYGVEIWKILPYEFKIEDFEDYSTTDELRGAWTIMRPPTTTLDRFEGYATDDDLRDNWVVARPGVDSVLISSDAEDGGYSMQIDYNLADTTEAWVSLPLSPIQNWTNYGRLLLTYKGATGSGRADLKTMITTARGDTLIGGLARNATTSTRWLPYTLDLRGLRPRDQVDQLHVGVVPQAAPASTVEGSVLLDFVRIPAVDSVSIATGTTPTPFDGDQAMLFNYNMVDTSEAWVIFTFDQAQDWSQRNRVQMHFRGEARIAPGDLIVKAVTAAGDTAFGNRFVSGTTKDTWQGYTLDLTSLDPRDQVTEIHLGVVPLETPGRTDEGWIWVDGLYSRNQFGEIELVGAVDTPGLAHDVALVVSDEDSFLYVADWNGGLRAYDFARPDSITLAGFYGVGEQYHSVSVADSIVFAGDHTGMFMLRYGQDWDPPSLITTVTQTPFLRSYLRAYVMSLEAVEGLPTVRHLLLPRQQTIEDFESYTSNDTLRTAWIVATPSDSVSIATPGLEGSQSMRQDFDIIDEGESWVSFTFDEPRDWSLYDQISVSYKGGAADTAGLAVKIFNAAGDSVLGETVDEATLAADWEEYLLDLTAFASRDSIQSIHLGILARADDDSTSGSMFFDLIALNRATFATKGAAVGDTLDVVMRTVSEEQHLYVGDFQLIDAHTDSINLLLISATDKTGNVSTSRVEYHAQLVAPGDGGLLLSPDSKVTLHVPPGATPSEAFFFMIPKTRDGDITLSAGGSEASSLPVGARLIGRPQEVGFSGGSLQQPVRLSFRMSARDLREVNPLDLGVYRQDVGGWTYIGGDFDAEERTVQVSTGDLGIVALLANPDRPEIPRTMPIALKSYPNPFNPTTTISYASPKQARVSLKIYDVEGRLLKTLVSEVQTAGAHQVSWNGLTDRNVAVTSGIYFARLEIGEDVRSIKMVLIR